MDIANLGYRVDSSQLGQANRALDANVKAAGRAQTATGKLEREANKLGKAWGVMTGLLASAAVVAVTRALVAAASAAAQFEQAMAEVSTLLSDISGVKKMSADVRELTKQFGGSVQTNAKALYAIISAGTTDAAKAINVLTVANKLAIGGVTDVATAADGLTSIMNAYGGAAGSATDVSDALFVAMRGGKTTIAELSAGIGMVAPIAATAGVSFDELSAAISAVTAGGVQTSVAVTNLRALIAAVVKPSADAVKISKALGIEFNLTGLKAKGLAGFLEEVREKTGGNEEVMAKMFGGVESLGAVFALTGNQAGTFTNLLEQQREKAGQTEEAYAKMSDTGVQKFARLKAVASDAMIEVGNRVTQNAGAVDELTKALSDPQLIGSLVEIVGLLVEIGKIIKFLIPFWTALVDVVRGMAGQVAGVVTALDGLASFNWNRVKAGFEIMNEGRAMAIMGRPDALPKAAPDTRFAGVTSTVTSTAIDRQVAAEAKATEAEAKKAEAVAKRLSGILGEGGGGGGSTGKSKAQQEADRLLSSYESLRENQQERIALHGMEGNAAKINYDIQSGALKGIDESKAKQLLMDAQHLDLLDEAAEMEQIWADIAEDHRDIVEDRLRAFEQVNQAILEQIELLGMTRDEQEVYNNLVWAGVDAESARGKEIIKNTELLQEMRKALSDQIEIMDTVRDAGQGLLVDMANGVKPIDALGDAWDRVHQKLLNMAAEKLMDQIFGVSGEKGGGSLGGIIGGLFGGKEGGGGGGSGGGFGSFFSSLFGGGRALGGDMRADRFYQVGERNVPELANIGGKQFMIPGDRGRVEPIRNERKDRSRGSTIINIGVEGQVTRSTRGQLAGEVARSVRTSQRDS